LDTEKDENRNERKRENAIGEKERTGGNYSVSCNGRERELWEKKGRNRKERENPVGKRECVL